MLAPIVASEERSQVTMAIQDMRVTNSLGVTLTTALVIAIKHARMQGVSAPSIAV